MSNCPVVQGAKRKQESPAEKVDAVTPAFRLQTEGNLIRHLDGWSAL